MDSGKVKRMGIERVETLRDLVAGGIFLMPDHLTRLIRGGWLAVAECLLVFRMRSRANLVALQTCGVNWAPCQK